MELSEPERAKARYQAVLSSLIKPQREAQLFAYSPLEARLQVGTAGQGAVPVLAQVLLAAGDSAAALRQRLQPLLDDLTAASATKESRGFQLRIVVVATPAEAPALDTELRALSIELPVSPVVQIFIVDSDGKVRSSASLRITEVGPALREQAKVSLTLLSEAEFAARCQEAVVTTKLHLGQVRDYALSLQARRTPMTYSLLALYLILFGLTYLWGGPEQSATLGRMGAASSQRILAGQWWRLLSATALHGGAMHLIFNSVALWNLGTLIEKLFGSARFLSLYILSGLVGSLLGTALGRLTHFPMSVGASGAICGLLAACAALGLRPRGELPVLVAQNLKRMAVANLLLLGFVSLSPHIDWVAHLGGAIAGALLTVSGLLRPTARIEPSAVPSRHYAPSIFGTLSAALLLLSIGVGLVRGQPWLLIHPQQRQRVALPGAPFSIEVPRSLGRGHTGTTIDGATAFLFDDPLDSPVELVIATTKNPVPLPTAQEREREAAVQWSHIEKEVQRANKGLVTKAQTIDGLPALSVWRMGPAGQQVQLLVQLRPDYALTLSLLYDDSTPHRMLPELQSLLESVRDEPR